MKINANYFVNVNECFVIIFDILVKIKSNNCLIYKFNCLNFTFSNTNKMENIYRLKNSEAFFVSIFLIFFAIIAFVPFILILIIKAFFSFLFEFRKKSYEEAAKLLPTRLENIYN